MLVTRELTLHLGGHPELVPGGTNRLVRFLGILHLALVAARRSRNELCAVQLCGLRASRRERRLRQRRRVGAHVGDVAVLVEPLGDAHRGLRRESELAARFLLQGRRHEGRRGASGVRLLLYRAHRERGAGEGSCERPRSVFVERQDVRLEAAVVAEVTALRNPPSVDRDEPRFERAGLERADDVPVRRRDEAHPLALALHHQARRHRLDAAGRQPLHHLLPQDGRHLVAVEPVENPSGLLGVDEILVDLAGLRERAFDRIAGDLVEHHPPDGDLGLQDLQ